MNWYLVKIVYQIICGQGDHLPRFEEQLRLLHASGAQEALEKARTTGMNEEVSFFNQQQKLVQWKFINVTELIALTENYQGAEVSSTTREVEDAGAYISFANDQAHALAELNQLNCSNR